MCSLNLFYRNLARSTLRFYEIAIFQKISPLHYRLPYNSAYSHSYFYWSPQLKIALYKSTVANKTIVYSKKLLSNSVTMLPLYIVLLSFQFTISLKHPDFSHFSQIVSTFQIQSHHSYISKISWDSTYSPAPLKPFPSNDTSLHKFSLHYFSY